VYVYETWLLILREELRVIEKRVLKGVLGPWRFGIIGG
jgi:hypothetical protein